MISRGKCLSPRHENSRLWPHGIFSSSSACLVSSVRFCSHFSLLHVRLRNNTGRSTRNGFGKFLGFGLSERRLRGSAALSTVYLCREIGFGFCPGPIPRLRGETRKHEFTGGVGTQAVFVPCALVTWPEPTLFLVQLVPDTTVFLFPPRFSPRIGKEICEMATWRGGWTKAHGGPSVRRLRSPFQPTTECVPHAHEHEICVSVDESCHDHRLDKGQMEIFTYLLPQARHAR